MITLDKNKVNSEILEYILKVGKEFCPMVDCDDEGFTYVAGTWADMQFIAHYNRGDLNFLSYSDYLNDEEIQANIEALGLDKDKFYLLILFITHYAKGAWEKPAPATELPYAQVESFCNTIIRELKDINNDGHAEFTDKAAITLKIGKKKVTVDDAVAIAYTGTMADMMLNRIKELRSFHAKGYKQDSSTPEETEQARNAFYEKLDELAAPNIHTYYNEEEKPITIDYNEILYKKPVDLANLSQNSTTLATNLIGCFATMFIYFLKDYDTPIKKSFTNQSGEKITISKYRLICKLIGLTRLTGYKELDKDFLYDNGDKVKGYITAVKKTKIKTTNKFYGW